MRFSLEKERLTQSPLPGSDREQRYTVEMKPIQIIQKEGANVLYGLGDDGLVYTWNYGNGTWEPYWNTGELRQAAHVYNPASPRINPAI